MKGRRPKKRYPSLLWPFGVLRQMTGVPVAVPLCWPLDRCIGRRPWHVPRPPEGGHVSVATVLLEQIFNDLSHDQVACSQVTVKPLPLLFSADGAALVSPEEPVMVIS